MKHRIIDLFFLLITLALGGNLARSATITWINTSGGNWSDAANWSPNQVPTNTDNALITTPGTYTVALDVVDQVANLTLGAGGGAAGVQTFVVTNALNVNSLLLVTGGGVLDASGENAGITAAMTVANGGIFNLSAGYYGFGVTVNPLIVTNGGLVNAGGIPIYGGYDGGEEYFGSTIYGTVTVANGGVFNSTGASVTAGFTVMQGGVLNVSPLGLAIETPMSNSGTINLTNGQFNIENYDSVDGAAYGELVNQPGGVINLQGGTGIGGGGDITNQGIIIQSTGTNSISAPVFDNGLGTITNLSGIMTLGIFQTNLTGTYYAAAGATIQFAGADIANDNNASQLTLGTPFVMGGDGQYQLTAGYLYLPTNVPPNLELVGDTLQLGPGFQGGAITNLSLEGMELLNALPVTGTLTATNSVISTNLTVANGGVLNATGSAFFQGLAVAGGGVGNFTNAFFLSDEGAITVAHAGTMNVEGPVALICSLTNAGTLNVASPITFGATLGGGTYQGVNNGILNQAGGLINLGSNASIIVPFGGTSTNYFINQGTIVQNAGIGATNTINVSDTVFEFDNSQGAITNLSGTLILPYFQGSLAGTFYAAAGATIQLGGGTASTPVVPGTPLVLGGSGQYQFISGYLYAPANLPANLSLQGGLLELGAGFQGGAITNLTLDGMELTNQSSTTLPVRGTFTIINSGGYTTGSYGQYEPLGPGVYGNYTVAAGGFLSLSNAAMYGAVTVTNGGVLNGVYYSFIYGNLTVANGGIFNGTAELYGTTTVAAGGELNPKPDIDVFGPMTNSGIINLTNSAISFYNDGTTNEQGSVLNEAGGLVDIWDDTAVGARGSSIDGSGYLINQGRIINSSGLGLVGLISPFATNSGTITANTATIVLDELWTLLPAGSLNIGLNSATNYGSFVISTNYPSLVGTADLAGAFNITLNNGYIPTDGTIFSVLSYGSETGTFSSLGLPATVTWQSTYGATNFTLVAGGAEPQFGTFNRSGTNLIFSGLGGTPDSKYVILTSTNLALPLANWTILTTNFFDDNGHFNYTNGMNPATPRQFFIFKTP
jgi:fibronectin-binding autotransporter adhesin